MDHDKKTKHGGHRGRFSGKIGYVLAVAGSAVGLGNIWRFPYLAAKYGGGIFLLVYILLTVSFGYILWQNSAVEDTSPTLIELFHRLNIYCLFCYGQIAE